MQKQWSPVLLLVFGVILMVIPGVRRMLFTQVLRNPMLRNAGLKLLLTFPFFREKLMGKILPTRQGI